jgi:hypothetical protein
VRLVLSDIPTAIEAAEVGRLRRLNGLLINGMVFALDWKRCPRTVCDEHPMVGDRALLGRLGNVLGFPW